MAKSTSISLDDHFAEFIEEQVAHGRYGSASDVVRAGLRLLEEQETRLRTLQTALIEGEQSGQPSPFDFDSFLEDKQASARRAPCGASSSPRARRDIDDIWNYSLERFGFDRAEAYLRDIQRAAETVAEDPRRGLACDEIRRGYRKFCGRTRRGTFFA